MNDDTHPIISSIRAFATNETDASIDGIANSFAVLSDPARVDALAKLRGHLDGQTSSRKTAELALLVRKCDSVHRSLRKVGR
jgi:hypothetical protein